MSRILKWRKGDAKHCRLDVDRISFVHYDVGKTVTLSVSLVGDGGDCLLFDGAVARAVHGGIERFDDYTGGILDLGDVSASD